jgi:hypothetical protein
MRTGDRNIWIEDEHRVDRLLKFLPAGPITDPETGEQLGERKHDIVQFIARHGGRRTIKTADLTLL